MPNLAIEITEHDPYYGPRAYVLDDAEHDLLIAARKQIDQAIQKLEQEALMSA